MLLTPKSKRHEFLDFIRSSGKYRYSRYMSSPLPYPGGKSRGMGYCIENFPKDIELLVSPFFGGGSLEIACAKHLGIKTKGFDIFDLLVNYWNVQLAQPKDLYKFLSKDILTVDLFYKFKKKISKHFYGKKLIKDPVELAAYFWINYNFSYGPQFLGYISKKKLPAQYDYIRRISRLKKFNVPNLQVECEKFETVIPRYKKAFIYADPPYYLGKGSTMSKPIYPSSSIPIYHENFDHRKLRDLLFEHKGGFVLSYNDCPKIRKWYRDFEIKKVDWQYTMGVGTQKYKGEKKSSEILIIGR